MYTQRYGLYQKPFENTPDPQFLFLSKTHREVLSSLVYGVQSAKGFILVSGDVGTGKTTLIYSFLKEIDASNVVLHIVNPKTNFNDISSSLAKKLDIDPDRKNSLDLLNLIKGKLIKLDKQEKRAVIIIDEAHLLSESSLEDIRIISNIETEKRKLIQIIIVGQNEIHHKLNKESLKALKQRIVINRKLTPFSKKSCFEYISHRLKIAGNESTIFKKTALNKIWEESQGIPRLINQLCDNALLIGFALDKDRIGSKIINEVIKDMHSDDSLIVKDKAPIQWTNALLYCLISVSLVGLLLIVIYPQSIRNVIQAPKQSIKQNPEEQLKFNIASAAPIKEDTIKTKETLSPPSPELRKETIFKTQDNIKIAPVASLKNNFDTMKKKPTGNETKIESNDYLLRIAKKEYGVGNDMIIDLIQMANPEIKNVNKIFLGQKITLPRIQKDDLIVKNNHGSLHIHYSSYYSQSEAKAEQSKLDKKNKVVFTLPVRQGENLVYRLYIGIFNDIESAKDYLKTINFEHLPFL